MEYKNVQKLFDATCACDKKHKLNTTNKNIPLDIVNEINKGITLEQLQTLEHKGFDIYKYGTQITVHGRCKDLTDKSVGYYQSLILNKNQSLGIKWTAVDAEKKSKICSTLQHFGWTTIRSSIAYHPSLIDHFSSKDEAIKRCTEYNKIAENISKDLFYGNYSIYVGEYFGIYYAVFDLFVNGIKAENVDTLLEQITGKTTGEIAKKINSDNEEKRKRHEEFMKKYEEEEKNRECLKKQQKEEFEKKLISDGYKIVKSTSLNNMDEFVVIVDDYDRMREKVYIYGKRTCKLKNSYDNRDNNAKYCKVAFDVWAKK